MRLTLFVCALHPRANIRKLISSRNNDSTSHNRFNSIVANKIKISAHLTGKGGLRRLLIVVWCAKLCSIYCGLSEPFMWVIHLRFWKSIKSFELGRFNIKFYMSISLQLHALHSSRICKARPKPIIYVEIYDSFYFVHMQHDRDSFLDFDILRLNVLYARWFGHTESLKSVQIALLYNNMLCMFTLLIT